VDGEDWLARDWAAANRRIGPVPDLSDGRAGLCDVHEPPAADLSAAPYVSVAPYQGPQRPRASTEAHIWFTRAWAVVKMVILAASTWWTMSSVHAHLGAIVCAYGAVALFSGVGARWRKRYFGPGQQLEPELYEALGSLLYRLGTVLVLVGGALAMVAPGLRA
jgi:hypothetical protein